MSERHGLVVKQWFIISEGDADRGNVRSPMFWPSILGFTLCLVELRLVYYIPKFELIPFAVIPKEDAGPLFSGSLLFWKSYSICKWGLLYCRSYRWSVVCQRTQLARHLAAAGQGGTASAWAHHGPCGLTRRGVGFFWKVAGDFLPGNQGQLRSVKLYHFGRDEHLFASYFLGSLNHQNLGLTNWHHWNRIDIWLTLTWEVMMYIMGCNCNGSNVAWKWGMPWMPQNFHLNQIMAFEIFDSGKRWSISAARNGQHTNEMMKPKPFTLGMTASNQWTQ